MSVTVAFQLDGMAEARQELGRFNKDLKGLGEAANDANRGGFLNLSRGLNKVADNLDSGARKMDAFGRTMQRTGRNLTLGLTLPLGIAAGGLIKFAAEAVESENLFEVAMGDMADEARAFSVELRKQLGLNEFEVRKQIGTFFQMTNAMGLSTEAAFSVSTGLTQLTNDMASFFNLRSEDAFQKLQAGITGEIEPLKRLGIVVNETIIQQTALNRGLIRQGEQMTEAQKVMARYLTIVEQTGNAQGDLARTLDSPVNQMRLLTAEIKQQAIELGTALLPVFNNFLTNVVRPAVTVFGNLVTEFKNLSPATQSLIIGFTTLAAVTGPLVFIMGSLLRISGLMLGAKGLAGLIKFIAGGTMAAAAAAIAPVVGGMAGLAASFMGALAAGRLLKNFFSTGDFKQALQDTSTEMDNLFSDLGESMKAPFLDLRDTVKDALTGGEGTDNMQKNMEAFGDTVREQMTESQKAIMEMFGEASGAADDLFKQQMKHGEKIRKLREKQEDANRDAMQASNDLFEHFAEEEIQHIDEALRKDRNAQLSRLQATRARFKAMGQDGVEAVNLIDNRMEDLEEQIQDRTFGAGARRAIQDFTDDARNLGQVAEDMIGGAFQGLQSTLSNFFQTGKLGFGDLLDTMKRSIADFLASQLVTRLLKFAAGVTGLVGGNTASAATGNLFSAVTGAGLSGGARQVTGLGGEVLGTIPGKIGGGLPSSLPGQFGAAQLGSLVSGAGAGFLGRGAAGLVGASGTGADVGSALGGLAGFAFGGPIGAGIGSFVGGIGGDLIGGLFAHGGDRVFSQPSFIGVGENGPERVRVTPLGGGGGSQGGDGVTVVFQGPNVLDDIGADRLARRVGESLQRRQRRGFRG